MVAIVQARMGSTRLPGKVLMDIAGRPMLTRVMQRLDLATCLDARVVATSQLPQDDPIAELCLREGPRLLPRRAHTICSTAIIGPRWSSRPGWWCGSPPIAR